MSDFRAMNLVLALHRRSAPAAPVKLAADVRRFASGGKRQWRHSLIHRDGYPQLPPGTVRSLLM